MAIEIKSFKPTSHKIKALVYGASGSGKTSFAGTAKNSIFLSAEGGLLSIANLSPNYIEIKSKNDLIEAYMYLKTKPHNFDTVIIDSITEINDIIKLEIEKKKGKPMEIKDWSALQKEIKQQFRAFRDLPMHTIFIAQEMIESKDEDDTVAKRVPALNGKSSTEIAYFMDIVGYVFVTGRNEYKVHTMSDPKLLTKDRTGLIGNNTPANFEAWVEKMNSIEIGKENSLDTFEGRPVRPAEEVKTGNTKTQTTPEEKKPAPTPESDESSRLMRGLAKLNDVESITRYAMKLQGSKLYSDDVKKEVRKNCAIKISKMGADVFEQVVSVKNLLSVDTLINQDELFLFLDDVELEFQKRLIENAG